MSFVAYFVLCLIAAVLGSNRTLGFWGYLLLSLVATPFVAFAILVIGAHKKKKKRKELAAG